MGSRKVLSMSNWTFNKDKKYISTGTNIQEYDPPYNSAKIEYVNVWHGNVWYVPPEIRSGSDWAKLNNVQSYSSIPQYWYVSNRSKKVKLWPIPTDVSGTIKIGYVKKIRDMSTTDYTTGSVYVGTANSIYFNGVGTSWGSTMIGRSICVTASSTQADNYWFEIDNVSSAGSLTVKESIPAAFGSVAYTIADLIPMPDGFEDLPTWYALSQYYQTKEKPTIAREYERVYKEGIEELINRDSRSATNLITKKEPLDIVSPNSNPWGITIS
jgi:hypothetical protein